MPIWNTIPVDQQPSVILEDWKIFEVEDESGADNASRHFVGTCVTNYREGRASSSIVGFDKENMRGVTRSGRVYQLVGLPRYSSNGIYVWDKWKIINGIIKETDVTGEIYETTN